METPSCVLPKFDLSEYEFNTSDIAKTFTWKEQCKLLFYVVVITLGVIGNIAVVVTVILNRSMRTAINIYLVNLAVADLMICLCCMWVHFVNNFYDPLYILGAFMCKFNAFTQMTCMLSSVLTLSTIACDRFVAIFFPLQARITKQRTNIVITFIWLSAAVVSSPFLFCKKHNEIQWKNIIQYTCDESWPSVSEYNHHLKRCLTRYPSKQLYYTFITICLFFLPILVMSTAYVLIIWKLWFNKMPGNETAANANVQNRAKRKVIILVCVVLLAFVICWAPMQAIVLYSQYGHSSAEDGELPAWFSDISYFAFYIAYSNSAINPIIYGGFNNNFRRGLCAVLKCGFNRRTMKRHLGSRKSMNTATSHISWNQSPRRHKLSRRAKNIEMDFLPNNHTITKLQKEPAVSRSDSSEMASV